MRRPTFDEARVRSGSAARSAEAAELFAAEGIAPVMNRFNRRGEKEENEDREADGRIETGRKEADRKEAQKEDRD